MLVKITDKNHELFGQILKGYRLYYDVKHTGKSPDLFVVESAGKKVQILSTKIDLAHYDAQLLTREIADLDANVGDNVMIIRTGSGCLPSGWDIKKPHLITKIDSSGHVTFKCGARMFRPDVLVIKA